MAIRVLSADELGATCSACHTPEQGAPPEVPVEARRLLVVLQQADSALPATEARAEQATDARRRTAAARFVRQAREAAQQARQAWHAFDLALMERSVSQAATGLRRADSVLAGRPRR
jgi:predicted lipid-binding transport protein (Tim44 family)